MAKKKTDTTVEEMRVIDPLVLGAMIRESRLDDESTQAEAAERAEVAQNYWSDVEKGKYLPDLHRLTRMAGAVNASALDWIRAAYK